MMSVSAAEPQSPTRQGEDSLLHKQAGRHKHIQRERGREGRGGRRRERERESEGGERQADGKSRLESGE